MSHTPGGLAAALAETIRAHRPTPDPAFVAGFLAARDYYGTVNTDNGDAHGAECDQTENRTYRCTCDESVQRDAAERAALAAGGAR